MTSGEFSRFTAFASKDLLTKRLKDEGSKRLAHIGTMSLTSPMVFLMFFVLSQGHRFDLLKILKVKNQFKK